MVVVVVVVVIIGLYNEAVRSATSPSTGELDDLMEDPKLWFDNGSCHLPLRFPDPSPVTAEPLEEALL